MKKGFTFQQVAIILLALIILIALIVIIITQKDQIVEALNNLFGASQTATSHLGDALGDILS